MTEFFWIRHGPTHARGMVGWTDIDADLSDRAALARLAALLPAGAPVISSDLRRAVATADALQGQRPRLPHDPALREMHFGAWEGITHDEAAAHDPALARALWETPGDIAPPGGESWNALAARVSAATEALADRHRDGAVVIVAHFGPILSQIGRAAGIAAPALFTRPVAPLSLTRLRRVSPGRWAETGGATPG